MGKITAVSRNHRSVAVAISALCLTFAATGCAVVNTGISTTPRYTAPEPTGIEGSWRSTENLYTASFLNNSTQWTEIDTGALLISGSYVQTSTTDYTLQLTSAVTGQTRSANCRLSTINTLNCTRDDGNQFSMVRTLATAPGVQSVQQT
ncbi:MAG: hypothetical protein AAFY99_13490 [Pseudomonadota bacterium]